MRGWENEYSYNPESLRCVGWSPVCRVFIVLNLSLRVLSLSLSPDRSEGRHEPREGRPKGDPTSPVVSSSTTIFWFSLRLYHGPSQDFQKEVRDQ